MPPQPSASRPWFVYLLECRNGRLYTGITTDLAARFGKHCSGRGAMFTRLNPPLRMLAATRCADQSSAAQLEAAVKKLPVQGKRALAADWLGDSTLACPLPVALAGLAGLASEPAASCAAPSGAD